MMDFKLTTLLFVACLGAQAQDSTGWVDQRGEDYHISYPDNWIFESPGRFGTTFQIYAPKTDSTDIFWENVSLLIQDLSEMKMDLDEYVLLTEKQVSTMITDGELLRSERVASDSLEYHAFEYTGRQGILTLLTVQYVFVTDQAAFLLTASIELEKKELYYEIVMKIFSSYKSTLIE